MGPVYIDDYIARILVEERLNSSRREPMIFNQIHLWQTISDATAVIVTATRRFAKSINRELHRWVDTQTACTWRDISLANC